MSDQDYENTIGRLDDRIAELEEELNRFRNGFQGGCYACEIVGEKNVELEQQLTEIANIAHHGGLTGKDFSDIRRLTLPYWDKAECEKLQREGEKDE